MNPKTKIFYFGRRINGRFDSFKTAVKRFTRKVPQGAAVVAVLASAFASGAFYSTSTVVVSANTVDTPAPILDRIAQCELKSSQARATSRSLQALSLCVFVFGK